MHISAIYRHIDEFVIRDFVLVVGVGLYCYSFCLCKT